MVATGLVAVLVVLFIALPKGNKPTDNHPARGTSPQSPTALITGPAELTGDGMRLELPAGWTGRVKLGGIRAGVQGELPVLQAGSFPLPIPDDDVGTVAEQRLPTSGIYINVLANGPPPTVADPTQRTTVPIQVKPSDFRGHEGAIAPNHARIGAVLNGRYFVIDVSLAGSPPPTAGALRQANLVLATFDRTG